jgi:hypothetical protein
MMINPGTVPVDGADEQPAKQNLDVFLTVARERGAPLAGPPVRDPTADRDGRFDWDLPLIDASVTRLLMPGVEVMRVRDDLTTAAPCRFVIGIRWWRARRE